MWLAVPARLPLALLALSNTHPLPVSAMQPSAPLDTVVPYDVAVEGLGPAEPAATAAPAAEAAAAAAPAAEVVPPAEEPIRAALAAERQNDAILLKAESLAAAASPVVEAASAEAAGLGAALPTDTTLNTTTASAFTPATCPANPLIALG